MKPEILVPVGTATYNPAVATAANGTTVVVWDEANSLTGKFRLLAATRAPSGKVKIHKLGPMSGAFPQASIAAGGDGTFAVVWGYPAKGSRSRIAARIWPSGRHGFGRTTFLSPGNASTASQEDVPQVAVDDTGTTYVVWEGQYGKGTNVHYQVVERELAKHGKRWGSPHIWRAIHCDRAQKPKCQKVDAHAARIAADGKGMVALSWTQSSGEVMAVLRHGSKFSRNQRISPATYGFDPPSIAESDRGKVAVVWEQSVLTGRRIESEVATGRKFPRHGQFLSGKGTAQLQAVALASNGSGVTAWEKTAGSGGQVLARVMTPRGKRWTSNVTKLTRPGMYLLSGGPSVAAADGHAFVAWGERIKNQLSVAVKVLVGRHWHAARTFPGLTSPVVSAANDPARGSRILGTVVWTSALGLQIAIFQ